MAAAKFDQTTTFSITDNPCVTKKISPDATWFIVLPPASPVQTGDAGTSDHLAQLSSLRPTNHFSHAIEVRGSPPRSARLTPIIQNAQQYRFASRTMVCPTMSLEAGLLPQHSLGSMRMPFEDRLESATIGYSGQRVRRIVSPQLCWHIENKHRQCNFTIHIITVREYVPK